jgi:2-oxoisovalerate dehydrogenase E1 component
MKVQDHFKKAHLIRMVEQRLLDLFKEGKISGTVHTCVGQELTGVFAASQSKEGDFVVSNHRGHGHYISFTGDVSGLMAELMGKGDGCSKGIGGSQHLYNEYFLSNGIQGGMLPIGAGIALANKMKGNDFISIAFMGEGTLGEGIVYETLNICSLWKIPIVFILERNEISQSTSFKQNFSGDISDRMKGFNIDHYACSIYNLASMETTFKEAFSMARNKNVPVLIEVEVARLNSHSKGDDNRDHNLVKKMIDQDPLNVFISDNKSLVKIWDIEHKEIIEEAMLTSEDSSLQEYVASYKQSDAQKITKSYNQVDLLTKTSKRYSELIYDELKTILSEHTQSMIIGEDIEDSNRYNPVSYGGAFKVTKDLSKLFGNRVRNTPISEQSITGIGIGLAINGYISIVEIMFGDFTTLAMDQLFQHASKIVSMYGRKIDLPFILRTPMGGFRGYGPTHSQSIEKHFLGIPGLRVVALNQLLDPKLVFTEIVKNKQPVLLVENKVLYTKKLFENTIPGYSIELCEQNESLPVVRMTPDEGTSKLTIICYGGIVNECLLAMRELLFHHELLIDLFVPSEISNHEIPFLQESINETKQLCIIEEGSSFASYSSEVIAHLNELGSYDLKTLRLSNNYIVPSGRELEKEVLPNVKSITKSIMDFII